jgi:hypothetical protein
VLSPQSLDEGLGQILRVLDVDYRCASTFKAVFFQVLVEFGIGIRNDVAGQDPARATLRGGHCVSRSRGKMDGLGTSQSTDCVVFRAARRDGPRQPTHIRDACQRRLGA